MPKIQLDIDDRTFANIRRALFARRLATGLGGLLDAFLAKVVEAVDEGKTEIEIKQKKDCD